MDIFLRGREWGGGGRPPPVYNFSYTSRGCGLHPHKTIEIVMEESIYCNYSKTFPGDTTIHPLTLRVPGLRPIAALPQQAMVTVLEGSDSTPCPQDILLMEWMREVGAPPVVGCSHDPISNTLPGDTISPALPAPR